MHKSIFYDLAWQHEAYLNGGLSALQQLNLADPTVIDAQTLLAWQAIDSNDPSTIAAGNEILLNREQNLILQPFYNGLNTIPGLGLVLGHITRSPLPTGRSFTNVMGPTGNIADFNERWTWITSDMLPIWEQMSQDQRSALVNSPLGSQVGPP